jgi:uncharacterized protein
LTQAFGIGVRFSARRLLVCTAALVIASLLHVPTAAQTQSPSPTATKKELVQQLLAKQQPAMDAMARSLVEQPAAQMIQAAGQALRTEVPAERREAAAKAIEADVKRYVEEATPLVRERAIKAAPATLGVMLEDKFNEDELRQLIAWFDSPVNKKYQQLSAEMQKGFLQQVVADSRPMMEPRLRALEQKVRATLGIPAPPNRASGGAPKASGP